MSDNQISVDLVAVLTKAAEEGNAKAAFHLGMMYANADNVELNYSTAAEWIGQAAEAEYLEAYPVFSWLFSNGFGVVQSDELSAVWMRKGAEAGIAKCQFALASLYRLGGGGIEPDAKQMLDWYLKAAEQDFAPAQHALGKVMAQAEGVAEDKIGAYQWLSLAVLNGSNHAKETLKNLASRMTKQERSQAQEILTHAVHEQKL
jgi:uncharacterized protein